MGRRSRRPRRPRGGLRPAVPELGGPRSTGWKHSEPGRPASMSAGQCFPSGEMSTIRRVPGNVRARSSMSSGGSSGSASDGMRCVSAIQIGKLVMTGPAVRSSGRPIAAIRAPSSAYMSCVPCDPPPNVGSKRHGEEERGAEPDGRPEPGDRVGPTHAATQPGDAGIEGERPPRSRSARARVRPRAGRFPIGSRPGTRGS